MITDNYTVMAERTPTRCLEYFPVDENLDHLTGSKWFCCLDLSSVCSKVEVGQRIDQSLRLPLRRDCMRTVKFCSAFESPIGDSSKEKPIVCRSYGKDCMSDIECFIRINLHKS